VGFWERWSRWSFEVIFHGGNLEIQQGSIHVRFGTRTATVSETACQKTLCFKVCLGNNRQQAVGYGKLVVISRDEMHLLTSHFIGELFPLMES